MSFGTISLTSLFMVALVSAAPAGRLVSIQKFSGETTGRYNVTFKQGADMSKTFDSVSAFASFETSNSNFLKGFAGKPYHLSTVSVCLIVSLIRQA